ncbi:hypothetical protein BDW74DRAFT_72258 [Aspergillus multicolor]|uniref:uncharacterized protein n=1 Tax=Aspergillus multicolor TaxID=41759 RepID=UPI003CCCA1DE
MTMTHSDDALFSSSLLLRFISGILTTIIIMFCLSAVERSSALPYFSLCHVLLIPHRVLLFLFLVLVPCLFFLFFLSYPSVPQQLTLVNSSISSSSFILSIAQRHTLDPVLFSSSRKVA